MRSFPGRDHRYDLAVVGAGFAGCEAALAAAREGLDVLLVTTSLDTMYMLAHGRASLDPLPGTLLDELVRRLGGTSGEVERWALHREAKYTVEAQSGIHLLQSNVTALSVEGERVTGVLTWEGVARRARATALCVGSFLGARLEQGLLKEAAGRLGEMAYDELYEDLSARGVRFESLELGMQAAEGAPPYTVTCRVLGSEELEGGAVKRLAGLYAAGVCASGVTGYEESAAAGRALGLELAAELRRDG